SADRLGKETLDELLEYQTKETYAAIDIYKQRLAEVNRDIAACEEKLSKQYRRHLEDLLDAKTRELVAHDLAKPTTVAKPPAVADQAQHPILLRIQELNGKLETLLSILNAAQNAQEGSALLVSAADKLLGKIRNLQDQFDTFRSSSKAELELLGIDFDDIISLTINDGPIVTKKHQHEDVRTRADDQLNPVLQGSPAYDEQMVRAEMARLQNELDEPNRRYQEYQLLLRDWEQRRAEIVGDPDAVESLEYYQRHLLDLDTLPNEYEAALAKRLELVRHIFAEIEKLAQMYRKLYRPVQEFIDSDTIVKDELLLNFDVSIVNVDLQERLFDWIGRNVAGSFYGSTGQKTLSDLIDRHTLNTQAGVLAFLAELGDYLT
ncbi:MAG: hypothetical protein MN733_26625, partial [Nitrososphaera sp.]|nr:hypothetical protein [Nitrososphaera sp.]